MLENNNSKKDNWDKYKIGFDIAIKFIEVVLLGSIALLIKFGADNIAQSLERGKLIQTLSEQLVQTDAKRDIALIALNEALPGDKNFHCTTEEECQKGLKHDQVFRVTEIVANQLIKNAMKVLQSPNSENLIPDQDEIQIAKEIIVDKTNQVYYDGKFGNTWNAIQSRSHPKSRSNEDVSHKATPQEAIAKNNISEVAIAPTIASASKDSNLKGIRLVYIQYRSDEPKAKKLQMALQERNIAAPGIEKVDTIKNNDIRYANSQDLQLAKNLRDFLKANTGIQIEDTELIDLSTKRYKVPSGQLEIWLKD
jgi:hypothetical protein